MNRNLFDNDGDFERQFARTEKLVTRGFKAAFILWILWALFCLCALAGVICVAIHFISKYW